MKKIQPKATIPWDGNPDSIKVFQGKNSLGKDGLWGPKTQEKYNEINKN